MPVAYLMRMTASIRVAVVGLIVLSSACGDGGEVETAQEVAAPDAAHLAFAASAVRAFAPVASSAGTFEASHPTAPLRARVDDSGVEVASRELGEWRVAIGLDSFGRAGRITRVSPTRPVLQEGIAAHDHGDIVEWYVMVAEGVEQGFTMRDRPPGDGSLVLRVRLTGLAPELDGEAGIALRDESGAVRAHYGALVVRDANGTELPASLGVSEGAAVIEVDDSYATYPIVIDPLVTTTTPLVPPVAERAVNGRIGYDVDVDGDTLVLGAESARPLVYVRGTTGWSLQQAISRPVGSSRFGTSVAISGDTIAIGDWGIYSVFIYVRSGSTWTLQQQITRSGGTCAPRFGLAVDLDGDAVVSGGYTGCSSPTVGGAYVYRRSGTTWSLDGTLVPGAPGTPSHNYGGSVAIDGDTIAVTDHPGAFVWVRVAGVWVVQQELTHGGQLALDGDTLVAGGTFAGLGVVIFRRAAGAWSIEHSISWSSPNAVSLSGDRLFRADSGSYLTGHLRRDGTWPEVYPRTAHGASSVAISGDYIVGGTPGESPGGVGNAGGGVVLEWVGLDVADACGAASECASGFCVDGVCCNSACGGGSTTDCQACSAAAGGAASNGTCGPLTASAASAITCRASTGACDVAETCSPLSIACPTDQRAVAGATCRAAAGGCDVAEVCDGVSAACPADAVAAAELVCRAAAGVCDVGETCDGSSPACPTDAFAASGTLCRASTGACDVADTCDGATAACPPDARSGAGTPCRPAAGACDVAESCDGSAADCPLDARAAAGTVCRPSAGSCDVAEACSGGVDCPVDAFAGVGTLCRASAGTCDVEEACSGTGPTCPSDAVASAGTECRSAAGACDAAESCDGAAGACPADARAPDGTTCANASVCDGEEACSLGACVGTPLDCDDGDDCTADACAEPDGCIHVPIEDCCASDDECDDGDACTTDGCGAGGTCEHVDACLPDGGRPGADGGTDGGITGQRDAEVPGERDAEPDAGNEIDAGTGPSTPGGCACRVRAGEPLRGGWPIASFVLALVLGRLRRSR